MQRRDCPYCNRLLDLGHLAGIVHAEAIASHPSSPMIHDAKIARSFALVTTPVSGVLPDRAENRWTMHRKAEVVLAVALGLLSAAEACHRYGLSAEEFSRWQAGMERAGMNGLRVTVRAPRRS